ncbi:hypothetical protein PAMA_018278 [Pampus argenteus]
MIVKITLPAVVPEEDKAKLATLLSDCTTTSSLVGLLQHSNAILWRTTELQLEDDENLTIQRIQMEAVGLNKG